MQQIPLQPVPSQTLQVNLAGQNCEIAVYLLRDNLYVDLSVNGSLISSAVIAQNNNPLVPTVYLGFLGNIQFLDLQGTSDPTYDGLGSRYVLLYLTESDYEAALNAQ